MIFAESMGPRCFESFFNKVECEAWDPRAAVEAPDPAAQRFCDSGALVVRFGATSGYDGRCCPGRNRAEACLARVEALLEADG